MIMKLTKSKKNNSLKNSIWFIHGYTESSEIFKNTFAYFEETYNLFAPDLPGYGLTKLDPDTFNIEAVIESLLILINEHSPKNNIIIAGPSILYVWAKNIISLLKSDNVKIKQSLIKKQSIYIYGELSINTRNIKTARELGLKCQKIKKCGHWPMLEARAEYIAILSKLTFL